MEAFAHTFWTIWTIFILIFIVVVSIVLLVSEMVVDYKKRKETKQIEKR